MYSISTCCLSAVSTGAVVGEESTVVARVDMLGPGDTAGDNEEASSMEEVAATDCSGEEYLPLFGGVEVETELARIGMAEVMICCDVGDSRLPASSVGAPREPGSIRAIDGLNGSDVLAASAAATRVRCCRIRRSEAVSAAMLSCALLDVACPNISGAVVNDEKDGIAACFA